MHGRTSPPALSAQAFYMRQRCAKYWSTRRENPASEATMDQAQLHEPTACRQVARGRRSSCDTATLFHIKSRRATLHQLFGLGHLCSQLTRDAVLRDTMSHRTPEPTAGPRTRCVVWSCVTQRRTVPHPLPIPACDAAWPCVMPPRTTPINNMTYYSIEFTVSSNARFIMQGDAQPGRGTT